MLYTDLTSKAMKLAYQKHNGQDDKAGLPYIFHPYHLAEQMGDDEYAICTALLHDVVEDTGTTFSELLEYGFPQEIIDALRLLTHDKDVPYLGEYIENIRKNPLARKVKLADLRHNSDPNRLPPTNDEAEKVKRENRLLKYKKAIAFLESEPD